VLRVHKNKELIAQIRDWKLQGLKIAFVPTMGNLHDGHLSLLRAAREESDKLISSIFVNPMQFGPHEDLSKYPRTLENDCRFLMEYGCDLVYLPDNAELYPQGQENITKVQVTGICEDLEGEFRPGHLTGVSTIVLKLFNLTDPDLAVFGKKDYQQWRLIEKMVHDLNLNIEIIGAETVRASDGLAMSSRNQYLNETERKQAVLIHQQLIETVAQIKSGQNDYAALSLKMKSTLEENGFAVDYVAICHQLTLKPAQPSDPLVVLVAAKMGSTRLIDNLEV
jgi:pantoate--beta-alanine ligase